MATSAGPEPHDYALDSLVRRRLGVSFAVAFGGLALGVAVLDYLLFGGDTGIPYDYPLFVGVVYLFVASLVLRRYHTILDAAKTEIVDVIDRTTVDSPLFERESEITPDDIVADIHGLLDWAFGPAFVVGGGVVGGAFAVVLVWALGALEYYPFVLSGFLYGAGHGLFYAPILGTLVLVWRTGTEYIVDVDVLDPDGVGGYQRVGNGIVNLVSYGFVLVALDAVVLSSVTFVDEPVVQLAIVVVYVAMVVALAGVAVGGILLLRHRLLSVREQKTAVLRSEFSAIEERYYDKLARGEPPEPESQHIETMTTMFDQLHSMELWPINLVTMIRLGASAGSSALIVAYQFGLVGGPG